MIGSAAASASAGWDGAALQALAGVGGGELVGAGGLAETLHADLGAGLVHHGEHRLEAGVLRAEQPAGGGVVVHHACGVAVDAHLLLQLADGEGVAVPEAAVGVGEELRDDEKGDALDAGGGAGGAGQDEVDDVLGEVVVAGGDEDLLAGELVGAVGLRLGPGAQEAEVGAGVRLGEVHGAGPFAGHQLGQVGGLLFLGAVGVDGGIGAVGEAGVHAEGHVGGGVHLADGGVQHVGQTLAAVFRIAVEAGPAAVAQESERSLEAFGRAHDAVLQHAALTVADRVQRCQHVAGDLAGLL